MVVLWALALWEEETAQFRGALTHISLELTVETMLPFPIGPSLCEMSPGVRLPVLEESLLSEAREIGNFVCIGTHIAT